MKYTLALLAVLGLSPAEAGPTNAYPLGAACSAAVTGAQAGAWTMDLPAARELAARTHRPILLFFTGSDWCAYCMQLGRSVLPSPAWQQYARRYVLVALDFPKAEDALPEPIRRRNEALEQEFAVGGRLPTFVFVDAAGKRLTPNISLGRDAMESPYAFIKTVATAYRRSPTQLPAFLSSLAAPAPRQEYEKALSELTRTRADFDAWMDGQPENNADNQRIADAFMRKLDSLGRIVERIESERALSAISPSDSQRRDTSRMLEQARKQTDLLNDLLTARIQLESWILSDPVRGVDDHVLQDLSKRVRDLQSGLAATLDVAPPPAPATSPAKPSPSANE